MNPITTGEQMLFAERDKFNRDDEPVRRGAYRQRYDGTVVRDGENDYEAIAKPDRDFVPRAGQNWVEDRVIAELDRERSRNKREAQSARREASRPRVQVMDEAAEHAEARAQVEKAWHERFVARGVLRRRAA